MKTRIYRKLKKTKGNYFGSNTNLKNKPWDESHKKAATQGDAQSKDDDSETLNAAMSLTPKVPLAGAFMAAESCREKNTKGASNDFGN